MWHDNVRQRIDIVCCNQYEILLQTQNPIFGDIMLERVTFLKPKMNFP